MSLTKEQEICNARAKTMAESLLETDLAYEGAIRDGKMYIGVSAALEFHDCMKEFKAAVKTPAIFMDPGSEREICTARGKALTGALAEENMAYLNPELLSSATPAGRVYLATIGAVEFHDCINEFKAAQKTPAVTKDVVTSLQK